MDSNILLNIAEEFGTPLYVYHAETIQSQYRKLSQAFAATNARFFYACKALSNINILKLLKEEGAGLDTVSIEEVKLGLWAGFDPQNIIFTPNCVGLDEILEAHQLGVHINIDNLSILEQLGNTFGKKMSICVRINPHIMAGGNFKISTGHIDSKFGISIHQLRHLERIVKGTEIKIKGIHMHTGSEIVDPQVFLQSVEILYDIADHFPDLEFIDLGSGFKVAYKNDDLGTPIEELGQKLSESFNNFREKYGKKDMEIWFEPGKFIVSDSGYFLVKTNVVKQTTATVFAGVNSGFNHLIRPMFYDAYHKISNISNPNGAERLYTVVGNICETDTFAWDRKISEIRENDILCFQNAGAYGFEMSSNYNSRLKPAEVLVQNNKAQLIRKRQNWEDLLLNQVFIQ